MTDVAYRAAPADMLRVERLGELTAIFDRRSMQTHLMVSPMPEILETMGDDSWNPVALAGRLAACFDLESEDDVIPVLADRLTELAAMGLVERA